MPDVYWNCACLNPVGPILALAPSLALLLVQDLALLTLEHNCCPLCSIPLAVRAFLGVLVFVRARCHAWLGGGTTMTGVGIGKPSL